MLFDLLVTSSRPPGPQVSRGTDTNLVALSPDGTPGRVVLGPSLFAATAQFRQDIPLLKQLKNRLFRHLGAGDGLGAGKALRSS